MVSLISHSSIEPFGYEASVDVARGLTEGDKDFLRDLFAREGLLLVRGRELSIPQQLDFCSIFGPVLREERDSYLISNVAKDGLFGDKELMFHHDIPYVPVPFLAGSLHALEATEGVTGTRFASGFRAYERLPQKLRNRIENLNAIFVRPRHEDRRNHLSDAMSGDNCAVHAVVQRQRGTGRPYIFVNSQSTACIIGMSEAESDALIEELLSYLYTDDNIYEHSWRPGDMIIWDNIGLQHARGLIRGGRRTLQRVTVARLSYDQQYPADSSWYGEFQEFTVESANALDVAAG